MVTPGRASCSYRSMAPSRVRKRETVDGHKMPVAPAGLRLDIAGASLQRSIALPRRRSAGSDLANQRVQIVVPFAPGSATDLLPRTIFEARVGKRRQPIIIENRPGGAEPSVSAPSPRRTRWPHHPGALQCAGHAPRSRACPTIPLRDFADHAARQRTLGAGDSPTRTSRR